MLDASLRGGHPLHRNLRVGTADSIPKPIVCGLLEPYVRAGFHVECREWRSDVLERELEEHRLDLLITDRQPLTLSDDDLACRSAGKSGVVLCGSREQARKLRNGVEGSGCSLGLPAQPNPLRERIDRWISVHAPRASITIEAEDRALLHHFASAGLALVPVPQSIVDTICQQFGLQRVKILTGVQETYYKVFSKSRLPSLL